MSRGPANKLQLAAFAVVVILIGTGGVLGVSTWEGFETGQDVAQPDAPSASATPQESAPSGSQDGAGDPTPEPSEEPSPSATPEPTAEPTQDPSPRPSESDSTRGPEGQEVVSPSGIAADIAARLDRSGPKTDVRCPSAVSSAVGTTFSCVVAYAEAPTTKVADAQVSIVGEGMRYVWRSTPVPPRDRDPSDGPTPTPSPTPSPSASPSPEASPTPERQSPSPSTSRDPASVPQP